MTKEDRRSIPFRYKLSAGMIVLIGAFAQRWYSGPLTRLSSLWRALVTRTADDYASVIREIRLPREIAAALVGAALAVSGAVMQGMTRNPLANPGLFGLTAGANAALAITLALAPATPFLPRDHDQLFHRRRGQRRVGARHQCRQKRRAFPASSY